MADAEQLDPLNPYLADETRLSIARALSMPSAFAPAGSTSLQAAIAPTLAARQQGQAIDAASQLAGEAGPARQALLQALASGNPWQYGAGQGADFDPYAAYRLASAPPTAPATSAEAYGRAALAQAEAAVQQEQLKRLRGAGTPSSFNPAGFGPGGTAAPPGTAPAPGGTGVPAGAGGLNISGRPPAPEAAGATPGAPSGAQSENLGPPPDNPGERYAWLTNMSPANRMRVRKGLRPIGGAPGSTTPQSQLGPASANP